MHDFPTLDDWISSIDTSNESLCKAAQTGSKTCLNIQSLASLCPNLTDAVLFAHCQQRRCLYPFRPNLTDLFST